MLIEASELFYSSSCQVAFVYTVLFCVHISDLQKIDFVIISFGCAEIYLRKGDPFAARAASLPAIRPKTAPFVKPAPPG